MPFNASNLSLREAGFIGKSVFIKNVDKDMIVLKVRHENSSFNG